MKENTTMRQRDIRSFEPFFGKWYIEDQLGSGSFGKVYRIRWKDYDGEVNYSALKTISIPRDQEDMRETQAAFGSEEGTRKYYDDLVRKFKNEIDMMKLLRGHSNIVFYEDHEILPKAGGQEPGYDILVRMELLKDLKQLWLEESEKLGKPEEVIQIGCDIATALDVCQEHSVIHRDIKPGNILRSVKGVYKLGDFGVARILDHESADTKIGTEKFIAPEVYNDKPYDYRADMYSLGLVLYYLLNDYRGPFLPPPPTVPNADAYARAFCLRMKGEKIPLPRHAPEELGRVICKACAYMPEDRYSSAADFRDALKRAGGDDRTVLLQKTESRVETTQKSKIPLRLLLVGIAACAVIGLGITVMALQKESQPEASVAQNQKDVPVIKEEPESKESGAQKSPEGPIRPTLQGVPTVLPIQEGEALEICALEGTFWDASINAPVKGILSWENPSLVPECSGEFEWKFLPEDSERYAEVCGKQFVTVLISDMLVGIDAVNCIEDKASLVKIDLSNCGLKDLELLNGAVNLQYAILDRNELTDIGVLANCPKLVFVSLVGNEELKDVSSLEGMEYLETVYLDETAVSEEEREKIEFHLGD